MRLFRSAMIVGLVGAAALLAPMGASADPATTEVAKTSPSAALRPASSAPPLTLGNFVIIEPNGGSTSFSGSVSVLWGGIHTWDMMSLGYQFEFADGARNLVPGHFDLLTDAQASLRNDPGCPSSRAGGFTIHQADYDNAGRLTIAAIQFDFTCADGTEVLGTLAYQILNTTPNQGYYIYDRDGALTGFGNDSYLRYLGTPATMHRNAPIVDMVTTPDGNGYWMVGSDGGVFSYGDAGFSGSAGGIHLNEPIVGMAATPDGAGYWLVASDGGVFSYGDAGFSGSAGGIHLNEPIVGMAATPSGHGYWLVASDGGIFSYGDAQFHGSTGSIHLNQPVVGMSATSSGHGYWLVAADGGIFTYGDATFFGSAGSLPLEQPVVGMDPTSDGRGYSLAARDGGVFTYGDAAFAGSLGGLGITNVVGMTS